MDSAVSSPTTPNSTCSSIINVGSTIIGSPSSAVSTPSPATPTATPPSSLASVLVASRSSGHKNSLKGTKLARRARSFKDDLFEKISLMRTPTNTLGRSHSPHSPRSKNSSKPPPTAEDVVRSSQSLETHVKDISNALKHFRDVISKRKLEVLPGNGTVILETIASMYAVIQSYSLNENSSLLLSATRQVYQSLGKLIKLCDEVLLSEEANNCASLSNENVKEVIDLLEDAVKNLVGLAQQKLQEKENNASKYGPSIQEVNLSSNHLMRPPVEIAGQRTSLPDITLTPKERDILEKTKSNPIRASHSTESILRDSSPPPKPPLPNRSNIPPPLPPKRRSQHSSQNNSNMSTNCDLDFSSSISLSYGVDHLSVRSGSPDENSSQCSLDSALNFSREEEVKTFEIETSLDDQLLEDDVGDIFSFHPNIWNKIGVEKAILAVATTNNNQTTMIATATTPTTVVAGSTMEKSETKKINNRHSNESGFVSMNSFRTSKRSSDYSVQSAKSSNIDLNCIRRLDPWNAMELYQDNDGEMNISIVNQQQKSPMAHYSTSSLSSASSTSMSTMTSLKNTNDNNINNNQASQFSSVEQYETNFNSKFYSSSKSGNFIKVYFDNNTGGSNGDNHSISNSSTSPEHFEQNETKSSDKTTIVCAQSLLSSSPLIKTNSLDISSSDEILPVASSPTLIPPALPPKASKGTRDRFHIHHDNFDETDDVNTAFIGNELPEMRQQVSHQWQSKHQSLIESRRMDSCSPFIEYHLEEPPPLPIKKKHILAYMEICSASTRSIEQHRHSVHTYNLSRNISHSQTMNLSPVVKDIKSLTSSPITEMPPALPPKSNKTRKTPYNPPPTPTIITTPPPSPKPHLIAENSLEGGSWHSRVLPSSVQGKEMSTVCEEMGDLNEEGEIYLCHSHQRSASEDGSDNRMSYQSHEHSNNEINNSSTTSINNNASVSPVSIPDGINEDNENVEVILKNNSCNIKHNSPTNSMFNNKIPNIIEEIDIIPYLVVKKPGEDGPEIKGGYIDALIVHASRVQKISDNAFSEAFITTFRTFIQPIEVIEKLTHRYTVLYCQLNDQKKKSAKETFSLLARVVNDLTCTDLTNQILSLLVEFVYQLVCSGELYLAKLLRNKIVEKVTIYKEQKIAANAPNELRTTVTNQPSLLDLKSLEIAEQMTLLDAELFQKIEIPEVLLFAKEQCEEKSPNLNKFTEHFNKMSYWARSKILMLNDAKDREKHVIKFIKIMKHLRKMNNYNSYLALLSALDSAPIRRLEWHKTITEGLKEYCTLIDSSSSFRTYRQALAETNPPCIPYIGLVLQDLTFVHVGNPDYLKEGVINFSKRWQQHNIIVNMKRFKKCAYPFKRNERIIRFFENFENFLGEEQMWQISENIKPRGKRQAHT